MSKTPKDDGNLPGQHPPPPPEALYMPVNEANMLRSDRYYRQGPFSPEGYDQWVCMHDKIEALASTGKKTRVARYVFAGYFDAQAIAVLTEVKDA